MASIQHRTDRAGNTTFRVQIRLKGHAPQTATFERLTDARKWAASTESAIREGRHFKTVEAKRHTFADLVNRYVRDVLPDKKLVTASEYQRQLEWWQARIGEKVLADVTPALISEYRDRLRTETTERGIVRSPSTANRYLAALSAAFSLAVTEWQWLDDNPCRRVRKLEEPRGRVRYLDDDERTRLLTACKESENPDLYCVVVLALSTGARKMELLGLRWRDVDLKRGFITFHDTKNNERRSVPLQNHALVLLKQRSKIRSIHSDLLFPSPTDPHNPTRLRDCWDTARQRAKVDDFRFHDLRHSAASYLAMNGATPSEIGAILGHKTLEMVKRYSHLSPEHLGGVVGRMNDQIFGSEI